MVAAPIMTSVRCLEVDEHARSRTRLPEIDWLRGFAALAVFFFHLAGVLDFPKRTLPPFELFGWRVDGIPSVLSLGASGVNLFFVISGFCLALQRWRRRAQGGAQADPLRAYARARFRRIVPAYWVALAVSTLVTAALQLDAPGHILAALVSHTLFLHGFVHSHFLAINGALWSMATEVQFYALFPALAAVHERVRPWAFVLAALACTLAFRLAVLELPNADHAAGEITVAAWLAYQLPGRLSEFVLGMALAQLYVDPALWARCRPVLMILAAPLLLLGLWARGWGPAYLPDLALGLAYAALVGVVLAHRDTIAASAIGRWLNVHGASFGRASYSFFLIHIPILLACRELLPATMGPWSKFLLLGAITLPLSLTAGFLLHRLVELRFAADSRAP